MPDDVNLSRNQRRVLNKIKSSGPVVVQVGPAKTNSRLDMYEDMVAKGVIVKIGEINWQRAYGLPPTKKP